MNDETLQFEQAEYVGDQPLTCGACQSAIANLYHELNGRIFCDRCRRNVEIALNSGSRFSRGTRAICAGTAAAVVGALLYLAFTQITGYELSLITIFIGYAVGRAVRWGSNGRGGWAYQTLAVVLTYLAIVSSYVPPVIQGLRASSAQHKVADSAATTAAPQAERPSVAHFAAAIVVLSLFVCAAPLLMGFRNAIGLVIIALGVYQAWQTNRRLVINFSGPHRTRPAATVPASAVAV